MSKTLATSITQRDPKGAHFMIKCGAIYDKAGLSEDRAQLLNEHPDFANGLAILIEKCSQSDNRFEFLTSFEVTVLENYVHATRLDTFKAARESEFRYGYNPNITDVNYSGATTQLVPGRKFQVKVFGINGGVTSDDCLAKLRVEKAVLVGAQGATLAYEQRKDKLPKGKWSVSFDEKVALWFNGRYHRVPCVHRISDGDFEFNLGYFENDWLDRSCLLCFCDLPSDSSSGEALPSGT